MQQNGPTHRAQPSADSPLRFPAEDRGRSLADVAQRDLDAALQLLTDRAQYITGASGAAIALRRNGMNDMLCRASTGDNAPELGALLSTEFGLSGESVRTRQALRCDDAERDARVNREVCRQLGIASVVVMPVVNDDEVLGVFELFSGTANAFGDRDLSAVKRLTEMVQTAVRLANAAAVVPEKLDAIQIPEAKATSDAIGTIGVVEDILEGHIEDHILEVEAFEPPAQVPKPDQGVASAQPAPVSGPIVTTQIIASGATFPQNVAPATLTKPSLPLSPEFVPKKKMFWSAALDVSTDAEKPAELDQSHVPPVLRGLRKCEACGFPVSTGRVLCVECEEKKWRGQLKKNQPRTSTTDAVSRRSETSGNSAAAATAVAPANLPQKPPVEQKNGDAATVLEIPKTERVPSSAVSIQGSPGPSPELVLSAGLEPSQSWISANKYILIALLAAVIAIAVFIFR